MSDDVLERDDERKPSPDCPPIPEAALRDYANKRTIDRLIAHIARLEGVGERTARIRHLPNEGKP